MTDALTVREPGPAERDPKRFRRRRRVVERGLSVGVPLVLLLLWQAASSNEWIDSRIYPSPTDIVTETADIWGDKDLTGETWTSIQRMLIGWAIGAFAGVALGLVMGVWRPLRAALEPLLSALYTVPKLALIPVFVSIFGFGEAPIRALIAVTVFFFVWISTLAAIVAVPEGYREAARSLGVNRREMFRHVLLPAALPQIFVGLRIAAGVALLILIGVEFVIADEGIGDVIEQGRTLFLLEQTYAGIAIAAVLGLLFMLAVRRVGRLLTPWAEDDDSIGAF